MQYYRLRGAPVMLTNDWISVHAYVYTHMPVHCVHAVCIHAFASILYIAHVYM
jgi:hypothetical protein